MFQNLKAEFGSNKTKWVWTLPGFPSPVPRRLPPSGSWAPALLSVFKSCVPRPPKPPSPSARAVSSTRDILLPCWLGALVPTQDLPGQPADFLTSASGRSTHLTDEEGEKSIPGGEVRGSPRRDSRAFSRGQEVAGSAGKGQGRRCWGAGWPVPGSISGRLASSGLRTLTLGAHGARLQSQQEQRGAERRQAAGRRPSRPRAHGGSVGGLRAAREIRGMLVPRPGMLRESQPERWDPRSPGGLGGATQAAAVRLRLRAWHLGAAVPKGAAPGARRAGSGYPRGEDRRHAGLTGRRLIDRTFFKRTVFFK